MARVSLAGLDAKINRKTLLNLWFRAQAAPVGGGGEIPDHTRGDRCKHAPRWTITRGEGGAAAEAIIAPTRGRYLHCRGVRVDAGYHDTMVHFKWPQDLY